MSNRTSPSIGYVIGTTRRLILKVLGNAFVKHDIPITIEQYIFLHGLRSMEGDVTQQDMANHTCKDKSAVLRTIDVLEKQELVKRSQVAGDRRKNTISATEQCDRLFDRIFEIEEGVFKALTEDISNEDYETTIRVLRQIQQNANALQSSK
ncbi:MarR family winged helix-turn-helix transcriptional regulator [Desertivirga brevis]|uniref:MarR family winged helix-turn-helix transcriptional regulator n=1 Tax=Desertivirga brevis TaxID=2810310 RepID=UPI001A979E8F|nr:MarR family winged helix-turn-helix transcriptional regulator [Pedobacter sp. SYSU D00873]